MARLARNGSSRWRSPREIALTVGAVLGVLCIAAALAAVVFGIKPLVFRSGSMAPAIDTGALAFSRTVPSADVAVGDVVSVHNRAGARVTHRVVDVDRLPTGETALTLRGDANPVDDPAPYLAQNVDRVFFHIDKAGYVVSWLSSPIMRVVIIAGVGVLLFTAFRPQRRTDTGEPSREPEAQELMSETASVGSGFAESTKTEVEK